jgi:hypothetical protein
MALKHTDYRFWLVFAALAVALLIACSGDSTPGGSDGSPESVPDSMTQS